MKNFTEKELSHYDGKNGNAAYVAYKGKVYDLSSSFLWKDGKHQVLHRAGLDLTKALEQAPHGVDMIKKFPMVGVMRHVNISNPTTKK